MYIRGALKIGLVAPVKPLHPYLVDDLVPLLDLHCLRISPWFWFRKAVLILLMAAFAVFLAANWSGSSIADTTTTVSDNHWFVVQQVGSINYYHVVGRFSASITAVWESFEVPGGVGGYHLRLYHHTTYGAYEDMVNCKRPTGRIPSARGSAHCRPNTRRMTGITWSSTP